MKSIVFDAGPIISLTTNNMLGLVRLLKEKYNGNFFVAEAVKRELVDKPLLTKKFKFEALQVLRCVEEGVINVIPSEETKEKTLELLELANNCFMAHGNWIRIVHYGEIASVALCLKKGSEAFVVDERTIRLLIENSDRLIQLLRRHLHTDIKVNKKNLDEFRKITKNIKIIRSSELITIGYEMGLMDKYILNIPEPKKTLLESILWGVKLSGCAISEKEIDQIIKLETK